MKQKCSIEERFKQTNFKLKINKKYTYLFLVFYKYKYYKSISFKYLDKKN